MRKIVIGLFRDRRTAQSAVADLEREGFTRSEISVVAGDEKASADSPDIGPLEGIGAEGRAGAGAAFGAAAGFIAGVTALAIPGIGPVLALGPFAAALTAAGIGAATGTLVGLLREHGVSEEEAEFYREGVVRGGVLVSVTAASDEKAERAASILDNHDAVEVEAAEAEGLSSAQPRAAIAPEPVMAAAANVRRDRPSRREDHGLSPAEFRQKRDRRAIRIYTSTGVPSSTDQPS